MIDETLSDVAYEKLVKEGDVARNIARTVTEYGVNDRQRWLIIWHIALELENFAEMQQLTDLIKEVKGDSIFLSKIAEARLNGKKDI